MKTRGYLLAISLAGLSIAQSLTGNRVLFLADASFRQADFSEFHSLLKGRGYDVKHEKATGADLSVIHHDVRLYDHLVLFSPKSKVKSKALNEEKILEFIGLGGNVMMVANTRVSDYYKRVAAQFGVTFDETDSIVLDPFGHNVTESDHSWQHVIAYPKASKFISKKTSSGEPIIFEGIAHSVSKAFPQIVSILQPSPTAYSSLHSSFGTPGLYGNEISLVSAHQSRNNARFTVFGSIEMFSNKYFASPISENINGVVSYKSSGNQRFIEDLVKWTFQEAGVIKSTGFFHSKVGENERPSNYRIKDEITYSINLTEYRDGKWVAFEADDVQLEVTMLDPHIRATLPVKANIKDETGNELTNYEITTTLPDVYGVFTFRVNYRREGLSGILVGDVMPIHPFRHNEFPRFLLPAYPYYAATFSMSAGFIMFSTIWLYNRDSGVLSKNKKV